MKVKNIILIILVIVIAELSVSYVFVEISHSKAFDNTLTKQVLVETKIPKSLSVDNSSIDLIKKDLETYNKLSPIVINDILNSIDLYSKKYRIPAGMLHAVFRVESEYNFWIEHPTIHITVHKKRVTTKAVGLGGIVWEFWKDSLVVHSIALRRSDLFIPSNNVEATAAILRWLADVEISKKSTDKSNLIDRIISRYYGAYNSKYHAKMIRVTSDLWLKRIANLLIVNKEKDGEQNTNTE